MVYHITKIVWVCSIDNTEWNTKEEAEAHERELLMKEIEDISTGPDTYFYTDTTCKHLPTISHILKQALKYTSDPTRYLYYKTENDDAIIRELLVDRSTYDLKVLWNICGQSIDNSPDVYDRIKRIVELYLPEEISTQVTDEMIHITDKAIAFYMNADREVIALIGVDELIAGYKDKVDMADSIVQGWRDHKD